MKLNLSSAGIVAGMAIILGAASGCGPGLSHRMVNAQDVLAEMDRELANSIPGTTTLTSAPMDDRPADLSLPNMRFSLSEAEGATPPPAQTWGAPREIDTKSPYDPN